MASAAAKKVFIVAAKRTPFGAFGGSLKEMTQTDLAVVATKAALSSGNIDPALIDNAVYGNVASTSSDGPYLARHAALRSGIPIPTPALTVNRLCGSGFQSAVNVYQSILLGESRVGVAGGAESMSQAPFVARGIRFGVNLGTSPPLEDSLWASLTDAYCKLPMGITAENLAEEYNISRSDADAYAIQSQQRWAAAHEAGVFADELAPVELSSRKGTTLFETDEHPRPQTQLEKIAKLPPVFKKEGTVSAANASGIADGAGALILASEEAVKEHGLKPLARLSGYSVAGVDPTKMGIGPVPAIEHLLKGHDLKVSDIDLVEINEAFASQYLSCEKALNLDPAKSNVHGGSIALGHPLGASGSRITAHLAHQIASGKAERAIGAACIGGGQGIALLLEKA